MYALHIYADSYPPPQKIRVWKQDLQYFGTGQTQNIKEIPKILLEKPRYKGQMAALFLY